MTVKWSWFVLFCFLHNAQWHNYFYWNLNDSYRLCNHWYLFVYVYLVLRWCRWSFIFNAMAMLLLFAAIVVALVADRCYSSVPAWSVLLVRCVFHAVFSFSAYRINYHRLYREQLWIDNKMSLYTDSRQRTCYTHNSSFFMLNKCGQQQRQQRQQKKKEYQQQRQTKTNQTKNNSCRLLFLCICIYIQKGQRIRWSEEEKKNGNARLHDVKHDLCKNLGTRWNADIVADSASDYYRRMGKKNKASGSGNGRERKVFIWRQLQRKRQKQQHLQQCCSIEQRENRFSCNWSRSNEVSLDYHWTRSKMTVIILTCIINVVMCSEVR